MKSIRKLYFQNESGDRWGLNGDRGLFCTGLAGLGLALNPTLNSIGQGFMTEESVDTGSKNTIPFTLIFTKSPYQYYQMLINWMNSAKTLTIVYNPTGTQEYYCDIAINYMQKGELNQVGWLEVLCNFYCVTPWYLPAPTMLTIRSRGKDERKRYAYRYTNALKYGMNNAAALSATVAGSGHIPGSIELKYYGAISNPRIKIFGNMTGKTYGACYISAIMEASDTLCFSSKYENSYVFKLSSEGVQTDLLDNVDLSLTPFFHVPINESCTITLESDNLFIGFAELSVYYYYRSV